ncbi:hypothetical protein ETAA8_34140 [Anatilimnocola aggregata]|uniref:DUF1501 domain-containing protein n=1 Tax=Anatilimnocola aggregata TaxID=2528021 RepID=A0A517YDK6_9BACT|nr:DUF1501 domain-containing protein [Anatilimnocola aggregata]QDU28314.1 hypothetical protein ETAA8_34140 [Anatilimnocola aggregata]
MMNRSCIRQEHRAHAFDNYAGNVAEGLTLRSRRNMLKAGMLGMAGLPLTELLRARTEAATTGRPMKSAKSCILLWMTGGPSHIDTWDSKPDRPEINRGPFGVTQTKLPGVVICEHLPKQAAMLDRFTIIRSVDAKHSNHSPNIVFQTANLRAEPRTNPEAVKYPALASVIAKHHGANQAGVPPYVAFMKSSSHLAFSGYLGKQFDPFIANDACLLPKYDLVGNDTGEQTTGSLFQLPDGLSMDRLHDRRRLLTDFDRLRKGLDQNGSMDALSHYQRQAVEMLVGGRARQAFDLTREDQATRDRYGKHLWCQQALVARRLVEAGVAFVTLDLSYHTASGTWDTHGDNIPPYGGIKKGLGPLLPLFDHLLTTLVSDLEERGLLDDTLVIAMGEFGRSPTMGTQGSTDGRNHWPAIMSMCLAGGGLKHGQVIGASESDGGQIRERPVTPGDLAATWFKYFDVPTGVQYLDNQGRPRNVIDGDGSPIAELF